MSNFVIVNGFDRSGTSAITRLLSSHDKIELIMQPFNSGPVRKRMYQINNRGNMNIEIYNFFNHLSKNYLDEKFIKSQWHYKYSTVRKYKNNQLHIIKTTINHFLQDWMKINFPEIDVWGIWRKPEDIVRSLLTNNFHLKWYKDGLESIKPTITSESFLKENYAIYFNDLNTEVKVVSFLIAVRTHFFLKHLDKDKLISYDTFFKNPNYLNKFIKYYAYEGIDFNDKSKQDLNIIGKKMKSKEKYNFETSDLEFMKRIFTPLKKLKNKFDD